MEVVPEEVALVWAVMEQSVRCDWLLGREGV